ncbi:uncharacterized protein LOC135486497 isoform X2 [Lineus longissimus]|uniref:uncharacterized protein LOC135486497 isoform X2 n=1 Tax=Lineus longissimus TaxID=88925 RepID=UPI002B4F24A4
MYLFPAYKTRRMQTIEEGLVFTCRVGKCPLDDYPMTVDRGQVTRTMCDVRRLKRKDQNNLLKASQVSETLYRHSRRMFNYALSRAGEIDQVDSPNAKATQSQCFSGPTRAGSPIYYKRIQVMNDIRTRPVTVPPDAKRLMHERGGKMLPVIKRTLARSNEDFRVQIIPMPPRSACPSQMSSHPDVLLVPNASMVEDREQEVADDMNDDAMKAPDSVEEEPEVIPVKSKKSLSTKHGGGKRRVTKHWVDELTVSSDGSNRDQQDQKTAGQTTQNQGQGQENANSVERKLNGEVENVNLDNAFQVKMGENGEIRSSDALPDRDNFILTLQELQEKQLTLPEFKCPSSEEKSREYAIREWLKHTSFTIGNRNVPLF